MVDRIGYLYFPFSNTLRVALLLDQRDWKGTCDVTGLRISLNGGSHWLLIFFFF